MHEDNPFTFYLTDFLCRHFDRLVVQGLKLDVHPELLPMYFGNYRRVVYLSQTDDPALVERGRAAAAFLGLGVRASPERVRRPPAVARAVRGGAAMAAELTVIWWRDIPAQVVAKRGRTAARVQLTGRFQEAIDMAATRVGLIGTDDYLDEWHRETRVLRRRPGRRGGRRRPSAWSCVHRRRARRRSCVPAGSSAEEGDP